MAGIAGPMSGVKGEPFDKGASGETPGSGGTEPGWNGLPESMAELALLWSLSFKGKDCSVGWGNGHLRSWAPRTLGACFISFPWEVPASLLHRVHPAPPSFP